MSRSVRKWLALLMLALVPFQGIAAASMAACIGMAGEAQAHDHSGDDHGVRHAHGHDSATEGTTSVEPAHDGCDDHGNPAKCCVAATAPAPSSALGTAPPAGRTLIPFLPASESSIVPEGLERPPRPVSA